MLGQRVEAALEVRERAARTGLAVHRHARNRAGGTLAGLEHRREGRIVALLAPPAFTRRALAPAFEIARTIVAAAGARDGTRRLDDGAIFSDHHRVAHARQVLRVGKHAEQIETAERARRLLVHALLLWQPHPMRLQGREVADIELHAHQLAARMPMPDFALASRPCHGGYSPVSGLGGVPPRGVLLGPAVGVASPIPRRANKA